MNELPGDSIGQILMELMLYLVEKGVLTSDDIKEITKIQPQMVIHIETTGKDNSILVGEGYISVC